MKKFFYFETKELKVFARLNTPQKIQAYLDRLPMNFEEKGETYFSPREVFKKGKAHCAEAAIFAAVALWYNGQKPLLLDLKTEGDVDHIVAIFKVGGCFGAISKTNHSVLRYRDPVYRTMRELALSYFHEYTNNVGKKTLRSFSRPYDLSKIKDKSWLTTSKNLFWMIEDSDNSKHFNLVNSKQIKTLRRADKFERKAALLTEWQAQKKK